VGVLVFTDLEEQGLRLSVRNNSPFEWSGQGSNAVAAALYWASGKRDIGIAASNLVPAQTIPVGITWKVLARVGRPPPGTSGLRLVVHSSPTGELAGPPIAAAAHELDLSTLDQYAHGSVAIVNEIAETTAGAARNVVVRVRNEGTHNWDTGPYGVHIQLNWGGVQESVRLPRDLAGGDEIDVEMQIKAPAQIGYHQLHATLVRKLKAGFDLSNNFRSFSVSTCVIPSVAFFEGELSDALQLDVVRIELLTPLPKFLFEEQHLAAIQITNTGTSHLRATDRNWLRIAQRWRMPGARRVQSRGSLDVPHDLEPRSSIVLPIFLNPPQPGICQLELAAMLHDTRQPYAAEIARVEYAIDVSAVSEIDREGLASLRTELSNATRTANELVYHNWIERQDTLGAAASEAITARISNWPVRPKISVLLPLVRECMASASMVIESLQRQIYSDWELCIAVGATEHKALAALKKLAAENPHVRLVEVAAQTNFADLLSAALDIACGEYCHLAQDYCALPVHSLVFYAGEIALNREVDWIYADSDLLNDRGCRTEPVRRAKPDRDYLRSAIDVTPAFVVRTSLLRQRDDLRGLRSGLELFDLSLRLLEVVPIQNVRHLPFVLYHLLAPEPGQKIAPQECERLLVAHFKRLGSAVRAIKQHDGPGFTIHHEVPSPPPLVSIIIPTRDRMDLLRPCIGSIFERTTYPNYEIVIIDNGSEFLESHEYFRWLHSLSNVRVIRDDAPFNWSRLNNRGVLEASGEILCLLNNDTEVLNENWLTEMVSHALRPDVGVVGAMLWYLDGTVQHAGVQVGDSGSPEHRLKEVARGSDPHLRLASGLPAVTGACMVLRKAVYTSAGGMDESFPQGLNDIDFCIKLTELLNLRCIWTPHSELIHKESASRSVPSNSPSEEVLAIRARSEGEKIKLQGRWIEPLLANKEKNPHLRPLRRMRRALVEDTLRPGARTNVNRYHLPRPVPLAFIHIPKTAGTAFRDSLERHLPDRAVFAIGARSLVLCDAGDQQEIARLRSRLSECSILFSHISHGFAQKVDWKCWYATILREPGERLLSHLDALISLMTSPLRDSDLANWPIEKMLRKGLLPGNLMVRKILGEAPEQVPWQLIDGSLANFAGFQLPKAVWTGELHTLEEAADIEPDEDISKVERALEIIERDFAFVGRQEALDDHLALLLEQLDVVGSASPMRRLNTRRQERPIELSAEAMAFNKLDRQLYDAIAGRSGGVFCRSDRLASWRLPQ
jgi:GT2 family glycosyltransferase